MFYTLKFRLYPSIEQEILIEKHFGCCRFVFNYLLWCRELVYKKTGVSLSWGKSQAVISILKKFKAFEGFFDKRGGYPRRKKYSTQSFTAPQNVEIIDVEKRHHLLTIPKFKEGIKVRVHRKIEGEIKRATIVQEKNGKCRYYLPE